MKETGQGIGVIGTTETAIAIIDAGLITGRALNSDLDMAI